MQIRREKGCFFNALKKYRQKKICRFDREWLSLIIKMVFSVKRTSSLSQESIKKMIDKGFIEAPEGFYINLMQLGKKQKRGVSRVENRYKPIELPKLV